MSGLAAPAIQTQPTTVTNEVAVERPGAAATGLETFDDLPPDNEADEGVPSASSGDALENEDNGPDLGAFDFETILNPVLAKKDQAAPDLATQEAVPVVATPAAQAAQAPSGQPAPAEAAVVAPAVVAPQAAQPQTPQATARPEEVFINLASQMEKNRETVVKAVAAHYEAQITDEDVELFQSDPKKGMAALAGRIHTDGLSNILTVISQQMPSMVYGLMEGVQRQQSATDSFYSVNTQFDRTKDAPAINAIAGTLRAQNPNMDPETFKATLAAMATVALKKNPAVAAPAAAAPRARTPRGFQPAGSAQAPANGVSRKALNPWDEYTRAAESEQ